MLSAVDAGQVLGAYIVAAVGDKWPAPMHGIAAPSVAEGAMARIGPVGPGRLGVAGGWRSRDDALDGHPDARRYRGSAPNRAGIVALAESLGPREEIGVSATMARSRAVLDGLRRLPVEITSDLRVGHRSQTVAFTTDSEAADAAPVRRLETADVAVGQRPFSVRLAVHLRNTAADADRLLDVVAG